MLVEVQLHLFMDERIILTLLVHLHDIFIKVLHVRLSPEIELLLFCFLILHFGTVLSDSFDVPDVDSTF